ncbi:MAG: hypothetical protein ABIF10_07880 [Candidatus Woesearchaeota archaeon]
MEENNDKHSEKVGHHKVEHRRKRGVKKSTVWMAVSGVLALLLVVSIATYGFRFSAIDRAIGDVDKLIATQSGSAKTQLQAIKSDLASLKTDITAQPQASKPASSGTDNVAVEFYVMSQCPFGTQVEDAIKPVLDSIGDRLDFSLEFIATDNGDGTFKSLHGENEVKGNIAQLCAAKYSPDKYMDMVVCQNKDAASIPGNWEACAKDNGLPFEDIKSCYEGEEGKQLLSESIEATGTVGATGSPTIYIGDEKYSGGRQTNDFLRAICTKFEDAPAACSDIPAPKEVSMIVLNDKRCEECDVSSVVAQLKSIFPGLKTEELDHSDAQGKKLYDELELTFLPALLFDSSVKDADGYANVQRYLEQKGDYLSLRIGASFDPAAEICDNNIDDTGNGMVDCDDETCKGKLICRPEIKNKLDVFVMSQCPFGVQALNAMQEVLDTFSGNIDFSVHYIADKNADGSFNSLHGQPEVDENIRELCAMKYYPNDYKYMDYVWCRNKAITSADWESCAKDNGMSVAMIKACAEGDEGKKLLAEDLLLAKDLEISASPTFLANNKQEFGGIDAETVKAGFCKANEGLDGCDKTLTGATAAPAGSCG